jgi:hypothetical protein
MELTGFGRRCWGERKKEVPNAKNPSTIRTGVLRRVIELARAGRRHSSRRLDQRSCEQPRNERHRPARRCKLIISAARRLAVQRWTLPAGSSSAICHESREAPEAGIILWNVSDPQHSSSKIHLSIARSVPLGELK